MIQFPFSDTKRVKASFVELRKQVFDFLPPIDRSSFNFRGIHSRKSNKLTSLIIMLHIGVQKTFMCDFL